MTTAEEIVIRARAKLLPPKQLSVVEWAEKHVWLPGELSALSGWFRIQNSPWLAEILECLIEPDLREVYVRKSARMGFTLALMIMQGYVATQRPGNILFVRPTSGEVRDFVNEQWDPFIRNCAPLEEVIRKKERAAGGKREEPIRRKYFPGGK